MLCNKPEYVSDRLHLDLCECVTSINIWLTALKTYTWMIRMVIGLIKLIKVSNIKRLNACWNDTYRKVLGLHRWESANNT